MTSLSKASVKNIYTTGHSLGGGLAQQAVYLHKDIKAAYVFDTSPITNWSNLYGKKDAQGKDLMQNSDPLIYRIQLQGEWLGYIRWITSGLTERRFGRSDYLFRYEHHSDNVFSKHNMSILACNFLAAVKQNGSSDGLAFGVSPSIALRLLSDRQGASREKKDIFENGETEYFCQNTNFVQ